MISGVSSHILSVLPPSKKRKKPLTRLHSRCPKCKGKKYLLLKDEEDLDAHGKGDPAALRESNQEIADAHALKESLRRAFNTANDGFDGYWSWCSMAEASKIPELVARASTVRNHMKGILLPSADINKKL